MPKHLDYAQFYISRVDGGYGYNVAILDRIAGSSVCDFCDLHKASYILDASGDLGEMSVTQDVCQECMNWQYANQGTPEANGMLFHEAL